MLTNRTVTGSGDFLVDTGTGQADVFADPDFDGDGILDTDRYMLAFGEANTSSRPSLLRSMRGVNGSEPSRSNSPSPATTMSALASCKTLARESMPEK